MKRIFGTVIIALLCFVTGHARAQEFESEEAQYRHAFTAGTYIGCSALAALIAVRAEDTMTFEEEYALKTQTRVMSEHGKQMLLELPGMTEEQVVAMHKDLSIRALQNVAAAWNAGKLTQKDALNCDALYSEIE